MNMSNPLTSPAYLAQRENSNGNLPSDPAIGVDSEAVIQIVGVNHAGLLASVAQALASNNVAVNSFRLGPHPSDGRNASIRISFRANEVTLDRICRKLARLINVMSIEAMKDVTLPVLVKRIKG
jgi:hypothetical protein